MREGERQVAPTLKGIRRDHVARYEWVADQIPESSQVLDIASGIGYGSWLLAKAGHQVRSIEIDREAVDYATTFYPHQNIHYVCSDINQAGPFLRDHTVCFEMIEHVLEPITFLSRLSGTLYASVPNETVFPFRMHKYHFRHYTKDEFHDLLKEAGFVVESWWGQEGPESEVEKDVEGRTLIAIARKK